MKILKNNYSYFSQFFFLFSLLQFNQDFFYIVAEVSFYVMHEQFFERTCQNTFLQQ